ncbi:fimbrial protein [Serratia nematodiphila]|uniref:Pilin (Type 1 fimbria component protein) n=1 Tax=Serratia nematodiphila TaxID=458197 RepID=A0A1G5EFS6_9GAMM|nr:MULTISPECIES: fimbrial protein [Serratia]UTO01794.1 fimbrial protein [Serratia nematodiphila]SCY25832.1 Pilin (type 1 fimbria component protein) [Serratia nematodiphila]
MKKLGIVCLILLGITTREGIAVENMSFKGTLREDVPCELNDGQPINVDFETVGVNKIDGERYKKSFSVKVSCPAEFDVAYKIYYVGQPSSFDTAALATNVKGLGIKAQWQKNGAFVDLGVGGAINGLADMDLNFQVVPVRKVNTELVPGAFNASASFLLKYE